MGPKVSVGAREEVDFWKRKMVKIELEEGDRLRPKVFVFDVVFKEFCVPWGMH